MNWAGGDPLLNTFIGYPEGELARVIFHELAHQVVYAKTTPCSTSPSPPVERLGGSAGWKRRPRQRQGAGRLRGLRRAPPAVPRAGADHASWS
jgi:predicted aminopeptidase